MGELLTCCDDDVTHAAVAMRACGRVRRARCYHRRPPWALARPWPGLNACPWARTHAPWHLALRCAAARCRLLLQFTTSLQQFPLPNRGNIMQGGKLGLGDEKLQEKQLV